MIVLSLTWTFAFCQLTFLILLPHVNVGIIAVSQESL